MSFEWRTDEDEGWQESPKPKEKAVSPSFWQRRWRFLLVALLGILGVWAVVQWQINQRINTTTAAVESELLATHNFVLQTAVDRDAALFQAILSGRNPKWSEVQRTLLNEGLLLDRPMLGWQHEVMLQQLTDEDVTITLDPTFNAAELKYPQTYAVQMPTGLTETLTLQQTAVYRLGGSRWLYSPPLDEFWGDWITQGGDHLTVAYPERDQDVAARLAIQLDELLGQMCTELDDLNCGDDLRVHLRLDADPESLLIINEIETMLSAGLRLELPSPTLVGLPTDEAGYEVLYRAYGTQLATAVLAHQVEYDCCRHELFFQALRDYQLANLDLQAWPLDEAMYSQVLSAGFDGNAVSLWTRGVRLAGDSGPPWQQVYMLVEYLSEQETAVSPIEMMRLLDRNSYHGWLSDVLSDNYDQDILPTLFLEYIYAQSSGGQQAEPPIPFPDGEIVMICDDAFSEFGQRVYAYDLASQTWREKLTDLESISSGGYLTTYDGKNFILTENNYVDPETTTNRFYLLTEDDKILLEEVDVAFSSDHYVYYNIFNGPVKHLVRYESEQEKRGFDIRSLDCPTSGCPEVHLAGYPTFSPNGKYIIETVVPVLDAENGPQNLRQIQYGLSLVSLDDEFRQEIGQGRVGFWVDNETYGFVQADDSGWELVISTISQPQPHVLLRETELLAEFPTYDETSTAWANNVLAIPNEHELILQVLVGDDFEPQNYLFRLQLTDDLSSVSKIDQIGTDLSAGGVGISPDGRYITLVKYNYASSSGEVPYYLLDLETMEISEQIALQGWYPMNWSPDGQWFVQNTKTYMLLHAPAYDYQYYIPHGFSGCWQTILSVNDEK